MKIFHILEKQNEFTVGSSIYHLEEIDKILWRVCVKEGMRRKAKEYIELIWGPFLNYDMRNPYPDTITELIVPDKLNLDYSSLTEAQRQDNALKCIEEGQRQFVESLNKFLKS